MVVPLEPGEEKGEHSEPEKDEDVGIIFVAHRGSETPKARPKSGNEGKARNAKGITLEVGRLLIYLQKSTQHKFCHVI